jgi:signal transduction histidine kinase
MTRLAKNNLVFIASAGAAIIVFFILIFSWYNNVVDNAIESHQTYQMQMGKTLIVGIEQYFNHIEDDLDRIHHELEESDYDILNIEELIDSDLLEAGITDIFLYRKNKKKSLYKPKTKIPSLKISDMPVNVGFYNLGLDTAAETVKFLFYKSWGKDNQREILATEINFNRFMKYFTRYLELSNLDFVWVLDGAGNLIYHPRHSEMVMRNIFDYSDDCMQCHSSFDMQKRMLLSSDGSSVYFVGEEEEKIMAHVRLKYGNISWVLAVSTYYPKVIGDVRDQFEFLGLTAGIVFLIIGGNFTANYMLNIKRLKEIEKRRLLEKERYFQESIANISQLASLGELVDTVAHEINTPMGIISALIDSVKLSLKTDDYSEEIDSIKKQIDRVSRYTKSLLSYSRRLPFSPMPVDLPPIAEEILALLGHRFRRDNINLVKTYGKDLPQINVDKALMEQVFLNLINNALDAVEPGGEIKLEIKNNSSDYYTHFNLPNYLISVEDNGGGIDESLSDSIFEAFFSTKEPGKGTGLGLYIVKNIVTKHNGKIILDKECVNTKFVIFLPLEDGSD